MWLFGYGSLIWKVDFPYVRKVPGHIKGFFRGFYQSSTDHRGTPEKPGRVVTLVPSDPEAKVWGMAYEIPEQDQKKVLDDLDYREKCGYERVFTTFYPRSGVGGPQEPFEIMLYMNSTRNKWFIGESDIESMADQIIASAGPSGTNLDYLYNLFNSMKEIAPGEVDKHLNLIVYTVKRKLGEDVSGLMETDK